MQVFLDVDDLTDIGDLEAFVEQSQAILIMMGSTRYFDSINCRREVEAAVRAGLPPIRVHEPDHNKNGAPLQALRLASRRAPLEPQ